ncbi:MAG TPA: DUF5997 family protein [Pseudolysinimonas sp.]|jgi:hypothetical protein|nr:DUF5997 family protein [Pseudolysinimonas sp.]
MSDSTADDARPDNRQQPKPPKTQLLKPENAAKKLSIYLPATPPEFQSTPISRDELKALTDDPPEWLTTLRHDGPHPRSEVARRLGISNSGLARAGQPDVMTTAEIKALLVAMPEWLVTERAKLAATRSAL